MRNPNKGNPLNSSIDGATVYKISKKKKKIQNGLKTGPKVRVLIN